jgi:hypothetical protein
VEDCCEHGIEPSGFIKGAADSLAETLVASENLLYRFTDLVIYCMCLKYNVRVDCSATITNVQSVLACCIIWRTCHVHYELTVWSRVKVEVTL